MSREGEREREREMYQIVISLSFHRGLLCKFSDYSLDDFLALIGKGGIGISAI